MLQRVTNNYMHETVLNNLHTNRKLLMDLQRQIASGKQMERASDDILSSITVISSNSSIGRIENYLKNIEGAQLEIEAADKSILTSLDAVHKARELTIQGLNATSGPTELNLISKQINQLIEQIKDIGNTKYGSKYIFGGKETGIPPFTAPAAGQIEYTGSPTGTHERMAEITEDVSIAINLCGEDIFGYYYENPPGTINRKGLLASLTVIKEQMESANPDKDIIRQELENLDNDMTTLLSAQSTLGALLSRLEITKKAHKDDEIKLTETKSNAEDIDFAQAISDLKFQESALQASLQVSAHIIKPSLLNYL